MTFLLLLLMIVWISTADNETAAAVITMPDSDDCEIDIGVMQMRYYDTSRLVSIRERRHDESSNKLKDSLSFKILFFTFGFKTNCNEDRFGS